MKRRCTTESIPPNLESTRMESTNYQRICKRKIEYKAEEKEGKEEIKGPIFPSDEDDGVRMPEKLKRVDTCEYACQCVLDVNSFYAVHEIGGKRKKLAYPEVQKVTIRYARDATHKRLWIHAVDLNRAMASTVSNAYTRVIKPLVKRAPWFVCKMKVKHAAVYGPRVWWIRSSYSALSHVITVRRNCKCPVRQVAIHNLRQILLHSADSDNLEPPSFSTPFTPKLPPPPGLPAARGTTSAEASHVCIGALSPTIVEHESSFPCSAVIGPLLDS